MLYQIGKNNQIDFIQDVLGIDNATKKIEFEKEVKVDGNTKFIDVYIPETNTLIEQKSIDKDLSKKYPQSGGWMATPFEQARRYSQFLPHEENAKWIVVCNFKTFEIHDMDKPNDEPVIIELDEIRDKLPLFDFMFKKEVAEISQEVQISKEAGKIVGLLYDKLLEQYKDPDEESLKSLNALCVRLVFCLYAEDAGIFGHHMMFHDYLKDIPASGIRKALTELFKLLDTKVEDRDKYLADENPTLAAFPYVNGGLFADETIEIPTFTEDIKQLLVKNASADFDWSDISPTIFGAIFESTLNPETRRSGGMHYTSIENIHKVIDPLFMDELNEEFDKITAIDTAKERNKKLDAFQAKLASLTFLDPACGSGNFLTETYVSLRRLENKLLKVRLSGEIVLGINPIKVGIHQFYGIEINDFAATVAKTALWIAESQMMHETQEIVLTELDFLPLKSYANILVGNALRVDWNDVVPAEKLSYIMGNPPFIGSSLQTENQKSDLASVFIDEKGKVYNGTGKVDYVAGWYFKACEMMKNTTIKSAFVSTNSITQGEQTPVIWKILYDRFSVRIDFAYRTFIWDSEAALKAKVHCVIIGFLTDTRTKLKKYIFDNGSKKIAECINGYLQDAPMIFIESRSTSLCESPCIANGFKAADNGYLILNEEEKVVLLHADTEAEKWIRPYSMGVEFINNIPRYCLWLKDMKPNEFSKHPEIRKRVQECKIWRENAKQTGDAYKLRDLPHLFRPCKQFMDTEYIAIPLVSSSNRRYMPMGFINNGMIPGNNLFAVFNANLFHFGILMSNVHMAWIRAIGGKLKSDWRYSKDIVYNNFPWPNLSEEQRKRIEETAQGILDARALYPDCSLADLYDELTMPQELRKAHQANDKAVMQAYGFPIKNFTEADCVAELMKLYKEIIEQG